MSMEDQINKPNDYGASQIQVLEGLEAVRKRPGMYIGSTSERGLHHLVWEIVDNSIDEALAGYCDHIEITIEKDNSISVTDNGRGIPVDIQEKVGKPAVEVILTVLHAGGKFDSDTYKVSGGLHGVGASVVNALSESLEVYVHRDGKLYYQDYKRGVPQSELSVIGETDLTGTKIHFKPDSEIFETLEFSYDSLVNRTRELAYLNKKLRISIEDKRTDEEKDSFYYEGGIREYVEYLNRTREALHEPIYGENEIDNVVVEFAIQYNDGFNSNIYSFANNIHTMEGGTHEQGFKTALTRVINDYARKNNLYKESDPNLIGEDVREGLTAIVSIKHSDPQFEGQTKTKLGNSEVSQITNSAFSEKFTQFLFENPRVAKQIVEKGLMASVHVLLQRKLVKSLAVKTPWKFQVYQGNWRTVHRKIRVRVSCILLRVTQQVVQRSKDATDTSKLFCRYEERLST